MQENELKLVVKEAVQETLVSFGFTVDKPHELQKDMQHIRNLRLGCEATKRNILKAFVTVTVPAALYILWEAVRF